MSYDFFSSKLDMELLGIIQLGQGLLKPLSFGDMIKQNNQLNIFLLSANNREKRGKRFSELCIKKEPTDKIKQKKKASIIACK